MASAWGSSWGSSWGGSWGSLAAVVVKKAIRSFRVAVGASGASVALRKSGAATHVTEITLAEVTARRSRVAVRRSASRVRTVINTAE